MEVLATASTFATLTGFAMQLYGNCKYYIEAAKDDCPNDLKLIMIEAASLKATLETVQYILEVTPDKGAKERLLKQIGSPANECKNCLEGLMKLVPSPMQKGSDGKMSTRDKAKLIINAVGWAASGKKGQCDALLKALRAQKATLNLGLTTELSRDARQMAADIQDVKAQLNQAQQAELYRWLQKINPSTNHNMAGLLFEQETGQWLTRSPDWKSWLAGGGRSRILWVHGIPGAGKTVLTYHMVEQIRARTRGDKSQGLAYYYCYHQRNTDETVPFLTWILSQLCRACNYIPATLNDIYDSGCEPTWRELLDCLQAVLARFSTVYVVVDAIDETSERGNLVKVLTELGSNDRFAKLQLAVTSREYQDIESAFKGRSASVSMSNEGVMEDIRRYVALALQSSKYHSWPQDLKKNVAAVLPMKARGMFRYAACQLEILGDCTSVAEVTKELNNLPASLDETYERILLKIDARHRSDAVRALAIIMGSHDHTGPILDRTLVSAVASWKSSLGGGSLLTIDMLKRFCICLVKVRPDKTVDLAHYTVREFLQSGRVTKNKALSDFALNEKKVDEIYCTTVLGTAASFSGTPNVQKMAEDANGDPVDFSLYALRRTRSAMFWSRDTLVSNREIKKTLLFLLNPYNPPFRGLQVLGSDGHFDMSHEIMFEWLAQFNPRADTQEKLAAHLTMIVGFEDANLVKEFLQSHCKSDREKAALFGTPMQVVFPVDFEKYRKTGAYDKGTSKVTVLDFYNKGRELGYDTTGELKMLKSAFAPYLSSSAPAPAAATPSKSSNSSHHHSSAPTPGSSSKTSSSSHAPTTSSSSSNSRSDPKRQSTSASSSAPKKPANTSTNTTTGGRDSRARNHGSSSGTGGHSSKRYADRVLK
ncbi:hypothetical protein C8A03DRAFT_18586 [Achaetomium macrosporum]|uniref:Nephrocystin 3-like N-terminal domain-containing protein n=1 Tax=Achaetomium macrosporum TaxID=79813 RepID=A0AAN7C4C5_9PEZI|nr:hypothetical protein C8A03DRAFT_18586 [Achaetomium macrosporum]